MTSIVGPFPGAEDEYRRQVISRSFASHRKPRGHRRFHRRVREGAPPIDWYGE